MKNLRVMENLSVMKNTETKVMKSFTAVLCVIAVVCTFFAAFIEPTDAEASGMAMKNWQQDEPSVPGYVHGDQKGTWWYKMYGGANFGDTGCGVMSLVNAVHYATGNFMDPLEIADWAYEFKSGGYRAFSGDLGTFRELLYPNVEAVFGSKYGFKIVDTGTYGKVSDAKFINHLKNGGTAVVHVKGHFMAVVNYNESTSKYLLWDNCAGDGRGGHRYGATHKAGDWLTANQLEGGLNAEYLTVDWYCLVSSRGPVPTKVIATQAPTTTAKPSGTPQSFYTEGKRYAVRIYQNSTSDESYTKGWGGLDGISDKTLSKDAVLYMFGAVSMKDKDVTRVGILVDNSYVIWPGDSIQKAEFPTRTDCYLGPGEPLGEHGVMFDISLDTATLSKGTHVLKLVLECGGALVEIGTRTSEFGGGCFIVKATSSGSKYVGGSTPAPTKAPTATPKATAAPTATPKATAAPTATPKATAAPTATPEATAASSEPPKNTSEPDETTAEPAAESTEPELKETAEAETTKPASTTPDSTEEKPAGKAAGCKASASASVMLLIIIAIIVIRKNKSKES